ncbi:MAG: phosphotransferase family protein [Gammaproteobacteria bacterium]|nr:phosphotransferase family protein [Gammaproteobacteria bacterium]MCP5198861.1 phosphotransferase family protein [Gammaproteobacteria bacterium]
MSARLQAPDRLPVTAVTGLPEAALARYLDGQGLGQGPLEVTRIGDGHSMLTFAIRRAGAHLVLRRPPPPPLPRGFHDVLREARIIAALAGQVPLAPLRAVCADESVIGAPFYVSDFVEGHVLAERTPAVFADPAARRRIGECVVDTLLALHALDPAAVGLADFGRPAGFLERYVARYVRYWAASKTREIPAFDAVADWLAAHLPASRAATIVHGDYRIGNLMFAPTLPVRLAAVLDWEMAALGDPLVDLGYLTALWVQPEDPPLKFFELSGAVRAGGFHSRAELVARYAAGSDVNVEQWRWYEVLALWRLAPMMEGNYRRAVAGEVVNPYLSEFGDGAVELAERALAITRGEI